MNVFNKTIVSIAFLFFMGVSPVYSQSWEEREEKRRSVNRNFWDWVFGDIGEDIWDESTEVSNIYEGLFLKIDLSRQWKFSIGDNKRWTQAHFRDQQWENISVPSSWEDDGFNGYDGYAWYRIHFDGRNLTANQTHFLILGVIDDVDETFINGQLIGKSGQFPPRFRTAYNFNRKYLIPSEKINFSGDNVIAVRVYDKYLNDGIVDGKPGVYSTGNNENLLLNLSGLWKFTKENLSSYSQAHFNDQDWSSIFVPSFWDNQGHRSFDGIAWYRKHFEICFELKKEKNYYLALGNIDDFDITYLNGKEIGRTDDGRDFGQSRSYQQIRLYKIPQHLLNKKGDNVIAVKVFDIGHEGGIYNGPVGIIEEEEMTGLIRKRD